MFRVFSRTFDQNSILIHGFHDLQKNVYNLLQNK